MSWLASLRKFVRTKIAVVAKLLDKVSGGRVSPDTITWTGVAAYLPIAVLIGYGKLDLAAVLLIFFGLFDVLDGELARYKKTASPRGMMIDASTDRVKEVLIYSGVVYYLSQGAYYAWTFIPLIACGATISVSYIKAKGEVAYAIKHRPDDHHKLNRLYHEGLVPFETRIAIIIFGLLIDQVLLASGVVAVFAVISIFERISFISKKV
ncbi:MAG TPA: CDP-alcohol phosphatidyltransferase family protein [Candidatus Saccharimonadales bacterium]|nr:CDP-alcohol phosphatidyltransferase family protein [Candidatus Saccharimonadales bacterium]